MPCIQAQFLGLNGKQKCQAAELDSWRKIQEVTGKTKTSRMCLFLPKISRDKKRHPVHEWLIYIIIYIYIYILGEPTLKIKIKCGCLLLFSNPVDLWPRNHLVTPGGQVYVEGPWSYWTIGLEDGAGLEHDNGGRTDENVSPGNFLQKTRKVLGSIDRVNSKHLPEMKDRFLALLREDGWLITINLLI